MRPAHIKGETIRVPKTISIDLWFGGGSNKGIISGYAIGSAAVDVYAENISKQVGIDVLTITASIDSIPVADMPGTNIVLVAAVPDGDIKEAIRTKGDRAAIMIGLGMVNFQDHPFRAHVGQIGICGDLEFSDPCQVIPANARLGATRMGWGE